MLTAFYEHRLPTDYDTGILRARALHRGALWDAAPNLIYKAFMLREAGQFGAAENGYASLYLWRHDDAFREFLLTGKYRNVTSSFGRAPIRVEHALDARRGQAMTPRFAYIQTIAIDADADLDATVAHEISRNCDAARHTDVVASVVSVDTRLWTITRTRLSSDRPDAENRKLGVAWQILHLARPSLSLLADCESAQEKA